MEELKGTERRRARNKGVLRKMVAFSPDGCLFLLLCVGCAHHLLSAVRCETGWRTEIGHQPDNSSYFGHPTSSYQSPYRLQAHSYVYIEQGSDYVQGRRPGILTIHDDTRTNEVESLGDELVRDEYGGEPLLVGHSHNPYGNSVKMSELEGFSKQRDQPTGGNESRGKRGVLHLYNMISCATGCDPISYKGYGCYCGFLGSGRALDGIDRCCKIHDHCYEDLFCPIFTVYFQPYLWRCHQGQPQCALENYSTRHQFINGCAAKLCECDRQLAMCLQRHACPRRRAICRSSPLRLLQNLLMAR